MLVDHQPRLPLALPTAYCLLPAAVRQAFTLVEMMVATALTLFIMAILSQAFMTSLEVFSGLKAVGDMEEGLRTAAMNLRADLALPHFEGTRRMSDSAFWSVGGNPREGFFRIHPVNPVDEGEDQDAIASKGGADRLHFTSRKRGDRQDDFYFAPMPTSSNLFTKSTTYFDQNADGRYAKDGLYGSQWAELAYFPVKSGTIPGTTTQLYALCRAQYLVLADPTTVNSTSGSTIPNSDLSKYDNFSVKTGASDLVFYGPIDLANTGNRRFDPTPTYTFTSPVPSGESAPPTGSTVLLPNVISFRVERLSEATGDFLDASSMDTASATQPDPPLTRAVKITIRVWDNKSMQARQVTVIQDL